MGSLLDLIEQKWGVRSIAEFAPKVLAVTVTQQEMLKGNPDRIAWYIFNLGANACYIHWDRTVSSTKGMYLAKTGGFIGLTWEDDGELVGYSWWIEAAGNTNVYLASLVAK